MSWLIDWTKRRAGPAEPPVFDLEALVPATHPLRVARTALDATMDGDALAVDAAEKRLGTGLALREHVALLLLETLYDTEGPAAILDLLRFDLAARWFVGWPDGTPPLREDELARALRAAASDPAIAVLLGRVLATPEVQARLGDRHWRVRPARVKAAARRARWGARRLRRGPARRWVWRTARAAGVLLGVTALGLGAYATLALPSAAEIRALLGRPTIAVEVGAPAVDRGRLVMPVPVDRATLPDAFVALLLTAEDRRFYRHPGFDPVGMGRAGLAYLEHRLGSGDGGIQGASTLTQQLVKNALLHSRQTLRRKFDELLLAIKLEVMFKKDELLELYLANAYFGAGVNGLELAARRYFGRRARELRPDEAALLVSLLPSPENYRADRHWSVAKARAIGLLGRTAERHPELAEALAAAARRLEATPSFAALERGSRDFRPIEHRYFRDWVLADLAERFPGAEGAHRLVLTLDPLAQIYAQLTVERLTGAGRRAGFDEAAVVVMTPDGTVLALVGGRSYAASQFSRATQARRQPGSAFKPVVYLTAIEAGRTAASIVDDKAFSGDGWPRNYQGGYHGKVTLADAFRHSLNGAAVQLAEAIGRPRVIETARRLGFAALPDEPSLTLGVGEVTLLALTRVYAVFANGGTSVTPTGVVALRSTNGRTVAWAEPPQPERLIDPANAATLNRLLRAVVAPGGSGNAANIGRHVAGKTGTTQHHRDAWFMGFTGDVVIGIWVGNDDHRPMAASVSGGTLPARAFANLLANLRDDVLGGRTTAPPGL